MAVFKCKMCGGDLPNIAEGNVVECEYCGSRQTIPTADNEKKVTLFARANRLRFGCEFDKAAGVYESIVAEFPTEAEAYWGLVLCKYGIEYVDDPKTGKKIPTCHRSSFDSVMEDDNFDQACENADAVARKVYRDEAKQIEELRKRIIEVSGKEEPYDIFICYKETDENGSRTLDSVLAQDIYNALTEKGYRVFFARISLEDKLGQEYEPYIFAALNSAKVMLAVGTDYEYYNAVWVKNEWSRYLALIAAGQKKTLIPCYKNIDAYDMPKEFARLQAQDMGKVGAMQDLLRGIEKIIGGKQEESKPQSAGVDVAQIVQQVMKQNVSVGGESNAAALLKRGYMALSDGDWEKANEFFDRVLDGDAENAEAYMGKFLAEEREPSFEKWAETFAKQTFQPVTLTLELTQEQKEHIGDMVQWYTVPERLNAETIIHLYPTKQTYVSSVKSEETYKILLENERKNKNLMRAMQFAKGDLRKQCDEVIATLNAEFDRRVEAAQKQEEQNICDAQDKMSEIFADADKQLEQMYTQVIQKRDQELESKYQDCCNRMNEAKSDLHYREVRWGFGALGDYKDSREKAQQCEQLAQKWMDEQEAKKARSRRNVTIAVVVVTAIVIIAAIAKLVIIPSVQYKTAVEMAQNGQYDEAIATFKALDDYKDARNQVENVQLKYGELLIQNGKFDEAVKYFRANDRLDLLDKLEDYDSYQYNVVGFAPFEVRIKLTEDGRVVSVSIPENKEITGLGADLIADQSVFDTLVGQSIETAQIDVKSGVTLTSNAINEALKQAKEDWIKKNGKKQVESNQAKTEVDVGKMAYTNEYEVTGFCPFTVNVEVDANGKIVSVSVPQNDEIPGFGADLIADKSVFDALVGQNIETAQIDVKAGVTLTSNAINDALKQAAQDFKK